MKIQPWLVCFGIFLSVQAFSAAPPNPGLDSRDCAKKLLDDNKVTAKLHQIEAEEANFETENKESEQLAVGRKAITALLKKTGCDLTTDQRLTFGKDVDNRHESCVRPMARVSLSTICIFETSVGFFYVTQNRNYLAKEGRPPVMNILFSQPKI